MKKRVFLVWHVRCSFHALSYCVEKHLAIISSSENELKKSNNIQRLHSYEGIEGTDLQKIIKSTVH